MDFEEPGEDDIKRLAEQLAVAEQLTARHAGRIKLDGSRQDLGAIQAVLDSHAFPGLDWAIINDGYGRDLPGIIEKSTGGVV
jgi:hypothetical protein